MNRIFYEKLKSLLLLILMSTSLIQLGILWRYQNHGFPISILDAFFSNISSMNISRELDEIKARLFVPDRIIVSDTLSQSHWIPERSGSEYRELWLGAQTYLAAILDPGFKQRPEIISAAKWDELIAGSPFAFIFKTPIPLEMVKLLAGNIENVSSNAPPGVYKMLISPWEDFNNNNTVYIFDGSKIYKYKLNFFYTYDREKYRSILKKVSSDDTLVNYSLIQELDPGNKAAYPFSRDVLAVIRGRKDIGKYVKINYVYGSIPEAVKAVSANGEANMDNAAEILLGREKDNYDDPELNRKDSTLAIRNQNSQYLLYQDGILEYEYLDAYEDYDKGSMGEAFGNALLFINSRLKRKLLSDSGEGLFLSGCRQFDEKSYEFTFDYRVGGLPVLFNDFQPGLKTGMKLRNAITIRANSRRVLKCWWVIRDFELGGQAREYNMGFDDLMRKISGEQVVLPDGNRTYIEDIGISYSFSLSSEKQLLKPVWTLDTADSGSAPGYYTIDMSSR